MNGFLKLYSSYWSKNWQPPQIYQMPIRSDGLKITLVQNKYKILPLKKYLNEAAEPTRGTRALLNGSPIGVVMRKVW